MLFLLTADGKACKVVEIAPVTRDKICGSSKELLVLGETSIFVKFADHKSHRQLLSSGHKKGGSGVGCIKKLLDLRLQ